MVLSGCFRLSPAIEDSRPSSRLRTFLRSILTVREDGFLCWYKHNSKPVDKSRIIFETINMWITYVTRNFETPLGLSALCPALKAIVGRD